MNRLIEQGIEKGLISFDAEHKTITYRIQNKKFRLSDSEEKVRANAYLSLVLDYGYGYPAWSRCGNRTVRRISHVRPDKCGRMGSASGAHSGRTQYG